MLNWKRKSSVLSKIFKTQKNLQCSNAYITSPWRLFSPFPAICSGQGWCLVCLNCLH